jgi:hypothetical protein
LLSGTPVKDPAGGGGIVGWVWFWEPEHPVGAELTANPDPVVYRYHVVLFLT